MSTTRKNETEGARNIVLTRFAARLKTEGLSDDAVLVSVFVRNEEFEKPLPEEEVNAILRCMGL